MSSNLAVVLEREPPDDLLPEEHRCYGQNAVRYTLALELAARRLGVPPLEEFIVDWCGRVEEAMRAAGPPEAPAGGRDDDAAHRAAQEQWDRVTEQVARDLPWHDPVEGLVTVRALIAELERDAELDRRCCGAVWDLRAFEFLLEHAEREGVRFYLAVSY